MEWNKNFKQGIKKSYLIISIVIALGCLIYFIIAGQRKDMYKLAMIYRQQSEEYLNNKYYENMIVTDNWSYYDGVLSYTAYPENNPKYEFRVACAMLRQYAENPYFEDYYLTSYFEMELKEVVDNISKNYFIDAKCHISINIDLKLIQDYYFSNKKPLSLYEIEYESNVESVIIKLYKNIEGDMDESETSLFIENIQDIENDINVNIQYIKIMIYENENIKKPIEIREYK